MKTFFNTMAAILLMVGIVMMAGSAGDCDGKCAPGNTISEMLMLAGIGLSFFITGAAILIRNQGEV
jgi:hypothetical protein|tara:strand:+ start:1838 stop:2035 length:198 start_codon:yes stop_codon:yes gene_type:complete